MRRWLPLALILTGALLGLILLRDRLGFDTLAENREALLAWRQANPLAAPLLFIAAYVAIVAFSIPGSIWVTLTGGFLFGLVPGALYNVTGATLGALVLFLAVRAGPGERLRERIDASDGRVQRLSEGIRANQVPMLLTMRFLPVVPFFVANLIPAFLGVSAWRFVWTTFVGIIPGGLVYTSLGAGLGEVFARGERVDPGVILTPAVLLPLIGLAALSLMPVVVKRIRGARDD